VAGIDYLRSGVTPDKDKVAQLMDVRRPATIKELRSALGMWSYFASFIVSYSITAAPLMNQLKRDVKRLTWTEECEQA